VVSNRRSVLERADRVMLLSEGSVAAAGTAGVLDASAEMRALCSQDPEAPVSRR
jgi:ABC-type protease/lipase transport system fused ATPase/permease subunit